MSIGRILVLAGSLLAIAGAAALLLFGSAPVGVFAAMLMQVTADGPDPLPGAIDDFLPAAIGALAFVFGVVAICAGMGLPSRQQSITLVGRILVVLSGVGVFVANIPVLVALLGTRSSFRVMATSAVAPSSDALRETIDSYVPLMNVGYAILLAAVALPLLAALVGFQKRPTRHWLAIGPLLPAPLAALAGFCYGVLFLLCWQQGTALKSMLSDASLTPSPARLAEHLSAILTISLIACPLSILIGGMLSLSGLLAPRPKRDD